MTPRIDEYAQAERLLGWLSVAFGITLMLSPNVKSFALMANVVPLPYWGASFVLIGAVTEVASRLNEMKFRLSLMMIRALAWGCVLATYVGEFALTKTAYPTQAIAVVCLIHSIVYGIAMWRNR